MRLQGCSKSILSRLLIVQTLFKQQGHLCLKNDVEVQTETKRLGYTRGASSLGAAGGCRNFWTDTWHVEAAEAAAEAAAAAAAVASATACAIRISEALFGASALACDVTELVAPGLLWWSSCTAGLFPSGECLP